MSADEQKAIRTWMHSNVQENLRPGSNGEVNRMVMAQNCAKALKHTEWLDDISHSVWSLADEVADWYEEAGLCRC